MQIETIATPQKITVNAKRIPGDITLMIATEGTFLITLDKKELAEVDRQDAILGVDRYKILSYIFRLGFNNCDALRNLQENLHGS